MKNKLTILILIALFSSSAGASEFGVLGGMSALSTGVTNPTGFTINEKGSSSLAAGAYLKHWLGAMFSFEVDALYIKKKLQQTSATPTDFSFESKAIQIPLILRASLVPGGLINVGFGGYYEIGMSGGVDATDNISGATGNVTYGATGRKHNDLGALGTVQIRLPIAPAVHVLVDARYLYGLTEQIVDTSTGYSSKNRYVQVLGGLAFGM